VIEPGRTLRTRRVAAHDAAKGRQTQMRVLSAYDLDRQVTSDGPFSSVSKLYS
jgi:hypothetical protein